MNALVTPWPSSITSMTTEAKVNSGATEMSMPPPRMAGVDAIASRAGVASSANVTGQADQDSSECCSATLAISSATASTAGSTQARSRPGRGARRAGTGRVGPAPASRRLEGGTNGPFGKSLV